MAKEFSYGLCPYSIMNGYFYVLLNKTSEESYYNFFKGKIEDGEVPEEAAQREFFEETGILVDKKDFEEYFTQKNPRKDIGIYLVDWSKYQHLPFHFQEKEIWSATWVQLKEIETSKNQQKIVNDIELFFKPRKQQLRNIYFPNTNKGVL
jgi:8-oxo-dGTP pyrophosphatase MutT (NUDIX family)